MITFERRHIAGDLQTAIDLIAALRDDLMHLTSGGSPQGIKDAPLLSKVVLAKRTVPCVIGHLGQTSGGQTTFRTSPLWAADWDAGWIRTANRFYRVDRILDVRTQ
jgi:hypothetical protein